MTKKQIKKLVSLSITNGFLDHNKVTSFSSSLKRSDVKKYIKALKNCDKQQSIIVQAAKTLSDIDKKMFATIFQDKRILFETHPSLLLGIKIINNDMEYEINLKNKLERLLSYLSKRND